MAEIKEVREKAREQMKGYCRVCPVCNGKACAGEVPGMGGLGTGTSFKNNLDALAARKLNMRLLHGVTEPDTHVEVMGRELSMPVLAAPIGGVKFNMGAPGVTEEDYIMSVLGGCIDAGVMGCTGDGVPPDIHESANKAIKALDGRGIPFIKPWEDKELSEKLEKAHAAGATLCGMDIDAAGLVTLRKMGRPVSPKPPEELARIIEETPMDFIIKGVMTPEEAVTAVDIGAAGIVVSNHGGRVLDHVPGTAEVLPSIASAVKGRVAVLADGGVRSGGDVLKMLALGADAVLIGRPLAWSAVGGGREGVVAYLEKIRTELVQAMVLTGTAAAAGVSPSVIR
jgi:isopentenyl diphosphate isomerase/L-lactate dehydrogenase-like FMN-dependent dehydrogenase